MKFLNKKIGFCFALLLLLFTLTSCGCGGCGGSKTLTYDNAAAEIKKSTLLKFIRHLTVEWYFVFWFSHHPECSAK